MKNKNFRSSNTLTKEEIAKNFPDFSCLTEADIQLAREQILKYYELLKDQSVPAEIILLHTLFKGRHFLTVRETALFLGVSTKTVLREIARGNLKSYFMGNKHRIPLAGVTDLLAMTDIFLN